jgi:RNA polymerase sigma-70 factor (ECF subfamily)
VAAERPGELNVEALYDEHFEFVWRSLRRLGVRPFQLEDAVQDVFVVVQRRLSGFEFRSSIRTWLFGIALRVAKAHRRRPGPPTVELLEDELVGMSTDPHEAALETEAAILVQRVLDGLSEERRAVFVLAELEEFTAAEIAESIGIPPNSVYSRLRLARRDFEAGLRRLRARERRVG